MSTDDDYGQEFTVQLTISAFAERTPPVEIELYGSAVKFLTYWMVKQNGCGGKDTEALFEELKSNVCKAMAAGTEGTA